MIYQIVSRCHVGESNRQVIKYFISRLKHGYKTWIGVPRDKRKEILREIIKIHEENRQLYREVTGAV